MNDYVKPTLKHKPNVIILHCGTNDLRHNDDDENVADNILKLALDISSTSSVIISGITSRDDRFKKRIMKVNKHIEEKCSERNIGFVDNSNILAEHLNRGRLHLNRKGTKILSNNIELFFKNWLYLNSLSPSELPAIETFDSIEFSPLKRLKSTSRCKNSVVISYLNVNSIRNKIDAAADGILENVDILCIGESKLDSSFPAGQFSVRGFKKPIRFDVSNTSGGLLLYTRENLPFQRLNCPVVNDDIQCIIGELNLRKQIWLILSIYKNPKQNTKYFLDNITNILDFYSNKYENIIIMGDFNEKVTQPDMVNFMSNFSLYNLIKKPTCYKSSEGSCIDLILTTQKRSFQFSNSYETGISDHHHLIYTMFRLSFEKSPPQTIHYRSFKNFSHETFRSDLSNALSKCTPGDFNSFNSIFESVLDAHYK